MLIFAGFLVGLIVGATGVGGGALMTPILLLIFGIAPVAAIGTDLYFAGLTKLAAGKIHHQKALIDWAVVKLLWIGSLPSSAAVLLLMRLGFFQIDVSFLKHAIGVAILITVVGLIFHSTFQRIGRGLRLQNEVHFKRWQPMLTIAAGALLGFLVTLTSVGAGAIGAVLLTYLYPLRLTPARLIATDIVHAIPLALFAGTGHLLMGNVDFMLLGWLLLGSIPGVIIGAKLSTVLPQIVLRYLLATVLTASAVKLLLS
jgi:uncharacterized membrane protein YfcA